MVFSNRAATLLALERYEEALADCERVLELDPKFMKGYLRKAMALRALGRKREALDVARQGLAIDKNMKIFLAQQNYHIGNFEENTKKIIEGIGRAKAATGCQNTASP